MAFRDVEPDPNYGQSAYLKIREVFATVGDIFTGLYQSDEPASDPTFGQNYTFKLKTGELGIMSIQGQLHQQLQKAKLQAGEKVSIKFIDEKDIGKANPMRLFKVRVESAPVPAAKPAVTDGW